MRKRYIVSYDIRDPKRLYKVHKKMRGYGNQLQYSVFLCDLSEKEKVIMTSDLAELINTVEDSIMIVGLGNSDVKLEHKIESIGKPPEIIERNAVVI